MVLYWYRGVYPVFVFRISVGYSWFDWVISRTHPCDIRSLRLGICNNWNSQYYFDIFPTRRTKVSLKWTAFINAKGTFQNESSFCSIKFVFTTFCLVKSTLTTYLHFESKCIIISLKTRILVFHFLDNNIPFHFNKESEKKNIPVQGDFWYQFHTVIYFKFKSETKFNFLILTSYINFHCLIFWIELIRASFACIVIRFLAELYSVVCPFQFVRVNC